MHRIALLAFALLACAGSGENGEVADVTGPVSVVIEELHVDVPGGPATGWLLGVVWAEQGYVEQICTDDDVCHPLGTTGGTVRWCTRHDGREGYTGIRQLYYRQGQVSLVI